MLIVPGRFNKHTPDEGIAGLRDAAPSRVLAARMLTRDEPQIGHERARTVKPPEIMKLGDDDHGRQRVDPAKAPQPSHRLPVWLGLCDLVQRRVQFRQPRLKLLNGQQVIIGDPSVSRMVPREAAQPAPMGLTPRARRSGEMHPAA